MQITLRILFILCFLESCNLQTGSVIGKAEFDFSHDLLNIYMPVYSYVEYVNYEPHSEKNWVFAKDTSTFYNSFTQELNRYFDTKKNIRFLQNKLFSDYLLDSCFHLLSRNSTDTFHLLLNSSLPATKSNDGIGIIKVRFVMNKETGTSGLGPMGNFTPLGNYYISFFVIKNNELVLYKSIRRPAIINGMFTDKRSKQAIKSFFKRI